MAGKSRLTEIRERQSAIETEIAALEAKDNATDEDATRSDALLEEFEELDQEATPLQERADRIAAMREQIQQERHQELGADTGNPDVRPGAPRSPEFMRQAYPDPWSSRERMRAGLMDNMELRDRAQVVIDRFASRSDHFGMSDDAAEETLRKMLKNGAAFENSFARQILSTSSPEYLEAFNQYLTDPGGYQSRAAMSLTAANGGYLVPFTLDPTIILTNDGSANPWRRLATVKQTTTNDWNGVTSAGVTAEWTAEAAEAADASPTVGQLTITPAKADAYLFGSYEVLGDSNFAAQLPGLLADAKDRHESSAFAVGTGTNQPKGAVVAAGTAVAGASGTAASGPTLASINSLQNALAPRWRGGRARNAFVCGQAILNVLRGVAKFSGATESIVEEGSPYPMIRSNPVIESSDMSVTLANGEKVLLYGDLSQYYIVDRVGMSVMYDPVVLGTNRRPTGQGAWYAFWRVGADVSTANALQILSLTT